MLSHCACWNLHKIVPVPGCFIRATWPVLLQVMEYRLPFMVITRSWSIFFLQKFCFWRTPFVCTDIHFTISRHYRFFLNSSCFFRRFLFLSFFLFLCIKVCSSLQFSNSFVLLLSWSSCYNCWFLEFGLSYRWIIWVCTMTATFYFFKLTPFPCNLITASPSFFQVMKDRLSIMEFACIWSICFVSVILIAAWSLALLLCTFHHCFLYFSRNFVYKKDK